MYDIKSTYMAKDVKDAINALSNCPNAQIIAGGSDMLIKIREGKVKDAELVCIREVKELKGIVKDADGNLVIGSLCSFTEISESKIIGECVPTLAHAVSQVGGPQIRNIGTIGGNICNGVTSADSGATLLAFNAGVVIEGKGGKRSLPLAEFYISAGKVDLRQAELVTGIIIKKADYEGYTGHYIKYAMRNAMDIATLACSVVCKYDEKANKIEDVRIAFGTAAPVPMRCYKTENAIKGMEVSDKMFDALEENVASEINPRTSWRASREFRLQIAKEISRRALEQAITGGECDV